MTRLRPQRGSGGQARSRRSGGRWERLRRVARWLGGFGGAVGLGPFHWALYSEGGIGARAFQIGPVFLYVAWPARRDPRRAGTEILD